MVTELIPGLYMFVLIHAAVPGARVSGVFPLLVLGLSMFSSNACLLRHYTAYVTESQWCSLLLSTFAVLVFTLPFTVHLISKWNCVIVVAENFLL